jgi:hypothetical protein
MSYKSGCPYKTDTNTSSTTRPVAANYTPTAGDFLVMTAAGWIKAETGTDPEADGVIADAVVAAGARIVYDEAKTPTITAFTSGEICVPVAAAVEKGSKLFGKTVVEYLADSQLAVVQLP